MASDKPAKTAEWIAHLNQVLFADRAGGLGIDMVRISPLLSERLHEARGVIEIFLQEHCYAASENPPIEPRPAGEAALGGR